MIPTAIKQKLKAKKLAENAHVSIMTYPIIMNNENTVVLLFVGFQQPPIKLQSLFANITVMRKREKHTTFPLAARRRRRIVIALTAGRYIFIHYIYRLIVAQHFSTFKLKVKNSKDSYTNNLLYFMLNKKHTNHHVFLASQSFCNCIHITCTCLYIRLLFA